MGFYLQTWQCKTYLLKSNIEFWVDPTLNSDISPSPMLLLLHSNYLWDSRLFWYIWSLCIYHFWDLTSGTFLTAKTRIFSCISVELCMWFYKTSISNSAIILGGKPDQKKVRSAGQWWHMPLISAPESRSKQISVRLRPVWSTERESSRAAKDAIQRSPLSKNQNQNQKKRKRKKREMW